jgi:hypothetical protein
VIRFRFLAGNRDFSLLQSIQTDSVAHPASHTTGTGAVYLAIINSGVNLTTHIPSGGKLTPELHLHSALCLHSMVLRHQRTEIIITLPLHLVSFMSKLPFNKSLSHGG